MTTFLKSWLIALSKCASQLNKKAVFMWKARGGGWVYAGKLDTAAARNTSARQMSQVCIFTQDNNKSILKGKWLQLRSWAELRLPFLLRTICAEPYPMWGFSPQKVLQEHVLIHILVNPRLWGRGCAVISTQKRTVTSLWIKAKAERGFTLWHVWTWAATTLGEVTWSGRGFGMEKLGTKALEITRASMSQQSHLQRAH